MKKLLIAFAVVAMASASQAAKVLWQTSAAVGSVTAASVTDNGVYANNGINSKSVTTLAATLALYDGETLVDSLTVNPMKWSSTGGKANTAFELGKASEGSTYTYVITISGTDSNLTGRGKTEKYDYTAATISQTLTGSVTLNTMGQTTLKADTGSWTVSGVQAVPEPTSAMLLLLGVAGLALKRKAK